MGKKTGAIYEPGELDRIRGKLGKIDESEAKRMAKILGGEVGTEKTANARGSGRAGPIKRENVEMAIPGRSKGRRSTRNFDFFDEGENESSSSRPVSSKKKGNNPGDDPSVLLKISYLERLKMDRYAAQFEFEIKNSFQVLVATLSFMGEPSDYVNPRFVGRRMNSYYNKIEQLVTSTRSLFPRNNARRSERLKKTSPFVYQILETIRHWNIERVDSELAKIQAHPRAARVTEFAEVLRAIYKPLFILDRLDSEVHIKGAYKLLYKIIHIENPSESMVKNQELIRQALTSYADVRREVNFGLYPLLMKFISDRWLPFDQIFIARRNRLMAFLGVIESEQIAPQQLNEEHIESGNLDALREDVLKEQEEASDGEEDPNDPKVIERKAREAAVAAEKKAQLHGLGALETLFPKAGWDKLAEYPDLYPYFVNVYGMRRGYELIAPTDPLQQIAVLMHILEDLCLGLRYVTFGRVTGPDGKSTLVMEAIGETITHWRQYIDDGFTKEYLPRLNEYCRTLEHSADTRNSSFAKRTLNELRWTKRLYFLPYYKFESLGPPPFTKQETVPVYSEIRNFRKYLTLVAAGIEQGRRRGGAEGKVPCDGIDNPWEPYNYEVPNPVSKRLDALLGPGKRNNAALVFFTLSTATVLDYLLNNEASWAYNEQSGSLFRSLDGNGIVPVFGIDSNIDADKIFKDSLKRDK